MEGADLVAFAGREEVVELAGVATVRRVEVKTVANGKGGIEIQEGMKSLVG